MKRFVKRLLHVRSELLFFGIISLSSSPVAATELIERDNHRVDSLANWQPVPDSELAELRGGFRFANGVTFNISVEKEVTINGEVEFYSLFHLADEVLNNIKSSVLLQNGLHNAAPELLGSSVGTIIQNNLDNQVISSITSISIDLGNIKSINLGQTAQDIGNLMLPSIQR